MNEPVRSGRRTSRAALCLVMAAALIGLAACGASDEKSSIAAPVAEPGVGNAAQLTRYLPTKSPFIVSVDLDAASKQLDLPAGADPFDLPDGSSDLKDPAVQFSFAATSGFAPLQQAFDQQEPTAITKAFDGKALSMATSNVLSTDEPVSVVKTSQPFDQIAKSLESSGFVRKGDEVRAANPKPNEYSSVADAGNGVVVVAANEADAGELVSSPTGGPNALEDLVEPADQPVSLALVGRPGTCVTAVGGWSNTSGDGVLRLTINGGADADSLDLGALDGGAIDPGEPQVDRDSIEIPFTKTDTAPLQGASPIQSVLVNVPSTKLYDCPDGS